MAKEPQDRSQMSSSFLSDWKGDPSDAALWLAAPQPRVTHPLITVHSPPLIAGFITWWIIDCRPNPLYSPFFFYKSQFFELTNKKNQAIKNIETVLNKCRQVRTTTSGRNVCSFVISLFKLMCNLFFEAQTDVNNNELIYNQKMAVWFAGKSLKNVNI